MITVVIFSLSGFLAVTLVVAGLNANEMSKLRDQISALQKVADALVEERDAAKAGEKSAFVMADSYADQFRKTKAQLDRIRELLS